MSIQSLPDIQSVIKYTLLFNLMGKKPITWFKKKKLLVNERSKL